MRTIFDENEIFLEENAEDIQAHIFSPHKKKHALYLFLEFDNSVENRKKIVKLFKFLGDNEKHPRITSVLERDTLDQKTINNSNEAVFVNIYMTAEGLEYFDCKGEAWAEIIDHLRSKTEDLSDAKALNKEPKQQNKVIHAMLLLAHEDKPELKNKLDFFKQFFGRYGVTIVKKEIGRVYRKKVFASQEKGFALEHFGYVDGLSGPWIRKKDAFLKNGKPKSNNKYNPTTSIHDFVVPEPSIDDSHFGSYLVYRKFEQNVEKFNQAMGVVSGRTGFNKDEIGSCVFGRTTTGVPVELLGGASNVSEEGYNNFDYKSNKCPFSAHIRKANPRIPGEKQEMSMIRRGITYGKRIEKRLRAGRGYQLDDKDRPKKGVGLLFFSFVNNIDNFQNVLNRCRDRTSEVDPLLGYINEDTDKRSTHRFKHKSAPEEVTYQGMKGLVKLQEGINLYMPSIHFFQTLKNKDEIT